MSTKFLLILIIALGFGVTTTNAQVSHRVVNQHERIRQGVKSGELTRPEAKNLRSNERSIHQNIKAAKSDGGNTRGERRNIKREERRNSRKIYRDKHNERIK